MDLFLAILLLVFLVGLGDRLIPYDWSVLLPVLAGAVVLVILWRRVNEKGADDEQDDL